MNLIKNTPLFFKKLPITEDTKPNATFVRDMGVVAGAAVCEIEWHSERWIVKCSEVLPVHLALREAANKYRDQIEAARVGKITRQEIAKAMGVSESTPAKRMTFVKTHATNKSN